MGIHKREDDTSDGMALAVERLLGKLLNDALGQFDHFRPRAPAHLPLGQSLPRDAKDICEAGERHWALVLFTILKVEEDDLLYILWRLVFFPLEPTETGLALRTAKLTFLSPY